MERNEGKKIKERERNERKEGKKRKERKKMKEEEEKRNERRKRTGTNIAPGAETDDKGLGTALQEVGFLLLRLFYS